MHSLYTMHTSSVLLVVQETDVGMHTAGTVCGTPGTPSSMQQTVNASAIAL
jgi:hypothetical protein